MLLLLVFAPIIIIFLVMLVIEIAHFGLLGVIFPNEKI
jgi:hypothetical protein